LASDEGGPVEAPWARSQRLAHEVFGHWFSIYDLIDALPAKRSAAIKSGIFQDIEGLIGNAWRNISGTRPVTVSRLLGKIPCEVRVFPPEFREEADRVFMRALDKHEDVIRRQIVMF
jgi:hypothetical protein